MTTEFVSLYDEESGRTLGVLLMSLGRTNGRFHVKKNPYDKIKSPALKSSRLQPPTILGRSLCSPFSLPRSVFVRCVLSSCRFPFVSCITFFSFSFVFPAFLGGGFCYSDISSRRYIPPRSLGARSMRIPLACCIISCVVNVDLFLFFSSPSLLRFRVGRRFFLPVFFRVLCCLPGLEFCCDSFSI